MSSSRPRIPAPLRFAVRLLPKAVREEALGDLLEHWNLHVKNQHWHTRIAWLWRQPLSVLVARLRFRGTGEEGRRGVRAHNSAGGASWLDFKLGFRMLLKYPGLTLVSVVSMSMAVAGMAGFVALSGNFWSPKLPLDEGDRVVALQNWNVATRRPEPRSLHDFVAWRDQLESVGDLGAFKWYPQNLITEDGRSVAIRGSEISASAFRVARVPPLLGRPLVEADEQVGAADVAVIGYDLWQNISGGDPSVVGSTVRLGRSPHTIVGVMPEGFRFPYIDNVWVPLRDDPLDWARLDGPMITVFGRLRDGSTLEEAQAELSAIGQRTAAEFPSTHKSLRPRVIPYADVFGSAPTAAVFGGRAILLMLLLVVCANVGALVVARNVTREREITVKTALGADRRRIVLQLFIEALVLASLASVLGLFLTILGLGLAEDLAAEHLFGWGLPFWWRGGLAPNTIVYVAALTLLGAAISGAIPALNLTARPVRSGLQRIVSRDSGLRFGRLSTWAIASQIAVSIAMLTLVIGQLPYSLTNEIDVPGLAGEEYLTAVLRMEGGPAASTDPTELLERYLETREELARQLLAEPGVSGLTLASALPGTSHTQQRVEVDGVAGGVALLPVRIARIDADFFGVLGAPVLSGRAFDSGDMAPDGNAPPVVIVNESFARGRLGDGSALGRRVRFVGGGREPGQWLEVVGVVRDFGMNLSETNHPEGLYTPLTDGTYPVSIAVHVGPDPERIVPQLRSISIDLDPALEVSQVRDMDAIITLARLQERLPFLAVAVPTLVAVFLSLSGVNALMSFTVSQRTREIGIRTALGAHPRRVVFDILSRALSQVGLGVVVGMGVTVLLSQTVYAAQGLGLVALGGAVMMATGLLACAAPTRRALRIQPTEAMRSEE